MEVQWYARQAEALEGHATWVRALRQAPHEALARLVARLRAREAAVVAASYEDAVDDEWAAVDRSDEVFFASEAAREAAAAILLAARGPSEDVAGDGERAP